jgi:hypothetical protein
MDPLIDARLKGIEEKLEQNHQLLVKIRRVQKQGQLFKIFYWVLIILATFGAFYYIQPYLNGVLDAYTGLQNSQEQFKNSISDYGSINSIIQQFKASQ